MKLCKKTNNFVNFKKIKEFKNSNILLRNNIKKKSLVPSGGNKFLSVFSFFNKNVVTALALDRNFCIFIRIFQKDDKFRSEVSLIFEKLGCSSVDILYFNKHSFDNFYLMNCDLPFVVGDLLLDGTVCAILVKDELTYRAVVRKIIELEENNNDFFFMTLLFTREFDSYIVFTGEQGPALRKLYKTEKARNVVLLEMCSMLLAPAASIRATFCNSIA